jgi:diguanylate cyclase (GGDEF)-like protein
MMLQETNSVPNNRTAQQLVCYEALFKLLDEIQPLEDIAEISSRVAKQWKYFANVASWHLVISIENGFKAIDGYRGEAKVTDVSALCPWDSHFFQLQLPRLLDAAEFGDGPEPPDHLVDKATVEIQVLPFVRLGRCIGLLSVSVRKQPFTELDNKFIRIFGSHFADRVFDILLRKHSLNALLNRATYDALTGLLNRGAILERLEMLGGLSRRTQEPLSVIIADIDHFKDINDRWGHLTGDAVLREVSRRLQTQTRQSDHVGRYGGEEFLFVLYPCGADNVMIAAERFRRAIADDPVIIADQAPRGIRVTISLGVATSSQGDFNQAALLARADAALYASKRAGRDRATIG